MKNAKTDETASKITREKLIAGLNEDLSREYQAIISYVVYSQVLKGAEYMNIAAELEKHAHEELAHALIVAATRRRPRSQSERLAKPRKCSNSTWRMKPQRFAAIARVSISAKRWKSLPWASTSAKFCSMNKTTRLPWLLRWA